jgi:hypothetical protein
MNTILGDRFVATANLYQAAFRVFRLVALVSGIDLLAGCASREAREVIPPEISGMPFSVREGDVSLGADPYVQSERQEQVFAADLSEQAVLPVQVVMANSADSQLQVDPALFKLALPGRETTAPRPGVEVAMMFPPEAGVAHYATTGVAVLGGLAGPIGAIAGRVAGLLGALMLNQMDGDTAQSRQDDYLRREFRAGRIGRGETARGFLYFVLPRGTPPFDEAMLSFTGSRVNGETASVGLLLKRLNVKGLPSSQEETIFNRTAPPDQ